MTKQEFLDELRKRLSKLPEKDLEERLTFYQEAIEDRIEEGLNEEAAVEEIGSIDEIVEQIAIYTPLLKTAKKKVYVKVNYKWWNLLIAVLGSPIWLSLLITLFAVALSIYVSLWAVIISLWAVWVATIVGALGSVMLTITAISSNNTIAALGIISAGICCIGLSIFLYYGLTFITKWFLLFTKKIAKRIKHLIVKEELK